MIDDWCSCCHVGDLSQRVCADGCFNLCTLITPCATGVQPHLAQEYSEAAKTRNHPHTLHTFACWASPSVGRKALCIPGASCSTSNSTSTQQLGRRNSPLRGKVPSCWRLQKSDTTIYHAPIGAVSHRLGPLGRLFVHRLQRRFSCQRLDPRLYKLKVLTVPMSVDLDIGEASPGEVMWDLEVFTDESI